MNSEKRIKQRKSIFKKITTNYVILRSRATKNLSDTAVFVKRSFADAQDDSVFEFLIIKVDFH